MSSSPDKTDARSMSDILASIRKIMAQDPASDAPAVVKPQPSGGDGSPRPGLRLPAPDGPRDQSMREQAPREPAPLEPAKAAPPAPQSPAAAATPMPSAKPATDAAAATPPTRTPLSPAADEPVSLDEFLALAAPPKDMITTPIVRASPAGPATPAAPTSPAAPGRATGTTAPSAGSAPDWLFPSARPTDDSKGDAVKEPVFGAAPVATPPSAASGPSLTSPRPASPITSAPKADAPPPNAPMASPMPVSVPAPMQARDAVPGPARAAPPAPKMLGDLGSVVPGRFDSQTEGTTKLLGEPSSGVNDRYSSASAPAPRPAPAAPTRAETARVAPAPDPAPAFDSEIPGADALRRLIAGVVPPSAMAPSAPARAPVPNQDDIRTEVVLPVRGRATEVVTVPEPFAHPAAPAAKVSEPAPAPKATEGAAPVTKSPEVAPVVAKAPAQPTLALATTAAEPVAQSPASTPAPAAALSAVRTLDETVVELLRPLLRDWLDTNMPRLIEPALKAELEALRGTMSKDKKD